MTSKPLCGWCQQRYDAAMSHELHPDNDTATRLHADLLRVCGHGYCPKPAKETK